MEGSNNLVKECDFDKSNKEQLHEVIQRTIEIDNLFYCTVKIFFKIEPEYDPLENEIIKDPRDIFENFLLEGNLGAASKADLILEIADKKDKKMLDDFKNKFIKFYKIRNTFAHRLIPKEIFHRNRTKSELMNWLDLNEEHKILFEEIKKFIVSNCF